jgi:prolyl-tRNA synthetase
MVMPPRIAPQQVVILPVLKDEAVTPAIMEYCEKIASDLKSQGIRVHVDKRDMRTPDKMWDAVKKGIPLRVEVGQREMEEGNVTHVRRDIGRESKVSVSSDDFVKGANKILDTIHDAMLAKSRGHRDANTHDGRDLADVKAFFAAGKNGFIKVPLDVLKDAGLEDLKKEYSLSARVVPFADNGKTVILGRAY